MALTEEDNQIIDRIRTRTRLYAQDINSMKAVYEKYINCRLKKSVDWGCPVCLRGIVDELITYQKNNKPQ